jgi:hypothetical protein
MHKKIAEMIKKMEKKKYIDDCMDVVKKYNPQTSFYVPMVFYKEIWVHPRVKRFNKQADVFGQYFCHVYQHKDDKKDYLVVLGKMGNTMNYLLKVK